MIGDRAASHLLCQSHVNVIVIPLINMLKTVNHCSPASWEKPFNTLIDFLSSGCMDQEKFLRLSRETVNEGLTYCYLGIGYHWQLQKTPLSWAFLGHLPKTTENMGTCMHLCPPPPQCIQVGVLYWAHLYHNLPSPAHSSAWAAPAWASCTPWASGCGGGGPGTPPQTPRASSAGWWLGRWAHAGLVAAWALEGNTNREKVIWFDVIWFEH